MLPNYPDILGYITDGQKLTFTTIEVALAIRPRLNRAGRPFEVVLLLQNNADVNTTVAATLQLPHKKTRQFFTRNERIITRLRPAEVGYMTLPVGTLPDTPPGDDYKIAVNLEVKPHGKPRRVRHGREINLDYYFFLQERTIQHIVEMRGLEFHTSKRGLLGNTIEAPLTLLPPEKIQMADLKPVWYSLWALDDDTDVRPLLERYHKLLRGTILPQITPEAIMKPLFKATRRRFNTVGYNIRPVEVHYIVKLMLMVLAMATEDEGSSPYHVAALLERGWPDDGSPIMLPNWCSAYLESIGRDDRVIQHPVAVLAGGLYNDLLRDAMLYGFQLIQGALGVELGSRYDMLAYANQLIGQFENPDYVPSFVDVYLPLVLGGILVDDRMQFAGERPLDLLHDILEKFEVHRADCIGSDADTLDLVDQVIHYALEKYGYRL